MNAMTEIPSVGMAAVKTVKLNSTSSALEVKMGLRGVGTLSLLRLV